MLVADFGAYLSRVSEAPSCRWIRSELKVFPINYFFNPVEFVKKYEKKCIMFSPIPNPQEGAIMMVYQISPTLHIGARLFHWIEQDKVWAYLTVACAYRNHEEYLTFFDENKTLRMTGNTEERTTGFNPGGLQLSHGFNMGTNESIEEKFRDKV